MDGRGKSEENQPSRTNMPDIHFECPKCSQALDAPEELATQLIDCPTCKETIEVPVRRRPSKPPSVRRSLLQHRVPKPVLTKTAPIAATFPSAKPKPVAFPKPKLVALEQPRLKSSSLAAIFQFFAFIYFVAGVAGGIGLLLLILTSSNMHFTTETSALVMAIGIGGGIVQLAIAKVIECLHEMTFRLRNLERIANHSMKPHS